MNRYISNRRINQISTITRYNIPIGGRGSQGIGQGIYQVGGYHNKNKHNISYFGYHNNISGFKLYSHTAGRQ